MTEHEAINIALKWRPKHKLDTIRELDKYFVVCLVPEDFKGGKYIGGAVRVDKKTGECRLYNPMLE